MPLKDIVVALERRHGKPPPPPTRDPFELVLWENAAYLVDDARRLETFRRLKQRVGLAPRDILTSSPAKLADAIKPGGMLPAHRAQKLLRAAELAEATGAPLKEVVKRPATEARRILKRFPGIGEPGADKLLLFSAAAPVLALESNGLRVLRRLGYGREYPQYARTYRSVQEAVALEVPKDVRFVQRAHLVLRRHGQEICLRSAPDCAACPLKKGCPSAGG
jgi:endonuclease-3